MGRNLAVSFNVSKHSGLLSSHYASTISYIAKPHSGDHTQDIDDAAFPFVTNSYFLVNELDVMADADTAVICALGESTTDYGATVNGHDLWSDDLSQSLHALYGDKISVVNMGIGGNTIVEKQEGGSQPVIDRLDRDVLGIAGVTSVVWMQGENELELGANQSAVIGGYKEVVQRLHAKGITVIGATITSFLWPGDNYDASPWGADVAKKAGNATNNATRKQINDFIRTSGVFDGVADMSLATEDPVTGALYKEFQSGDYIHPNRAGHQAMAGAVNLSILIRPYAAKSPSQ